MATITTVTRRARGKLYTYAPCARERHLRPDAYEVIHGSHGESLSEMSPH